MGASRFIKAFADHLCLVCAVVVAAVELVLVEWKGDLSERNLIML